MKKFLVALAITSSALVASAPASAQYGGARQDYRHDYQQDDRGFRGGNIRQQLDRINFRIERGIQNGALTRGEAQRLRGELNNVANLADRYRRDGLSGWERSQLERRIAWLQQRVQFERRDDQRRNYR